MVGRLVMLRHGFTGPIPRSSWTTPSRQLFRVAIRIIRGPLPVPPTTPPPQLNLKAVDLFAEILQLLKLISSPRSLRDIRHKSFPLRRSLVWIYYGLVSILHVLLFLSSLPFLPPSSPRGGPGLISSCRSLTIMWTFHDWEVPSSYEASGGVRSLQKMPIVVTQSCSHQSI